MLFIFFLTTKKCCIHDIQGKQLDHDIIILECYKLFLKSNNSQTRSYNGEKIDVFYASICVYVSSRCLIQNCAQRKRQIHLSKVIKDKHNFSFYSVTDASKFEKFHQNINNKIPYITSKYMDFHKSFYNL